MLDKRNPRLALKVWLPLPGFLLKKGFARTIQSIVGCINEKELINTYLTDMSKIKLYNRAYNLYPALLMRLTARPDQQTFTMVRQITGLKIFTLKDTDKLVSEIKRMKDKIREFLPDDYERRAEVSLEKVVAATESLLGFSIDRKIKMYQFKELYNMSIEKAKMYERNTNYG